MKKSPGNISIDRQKLARIRENIKDAHQLLAVLGVQTVRVNAKEIWCKSPFREEANPSLMTS